MLKTKTAILSALMIINAAGPRAFATDDFCSSTKGLDEIAEVVNCKSLPSLLACSAAGGAAVGAGAKVGVEALRKRIGASYEKQMVTLVDEMASQLHDEWRGPREIKDFAKYEAGLKYEILAQAEALKTTEPGEKYTKAKANLSAVEEELKLAQSAKLKGGITYQPRPKVVNGKTFDIANLSYKELPEKFQYENKESARVTFEKVVQKLKSGKPLDAKFVEEASDEIHKEWLKRNGEWAATEQKLPFNQLSKVEADKDRVIARKAIGNLLGKSGVVTKKAMSGVLLGAGRGIGWLMGATATGIFAAGSVIADGQVGCAELRDKFVAIDKDCKPVYAVDEQKVLPFLVADDSEKLNALKTVPGVCDYYKKLHSKVTAPLSFKNEQCGSSGEGSVEVSNGNESFQATGRAASGKLAAIDFNYRHGGRAQRSTVRLGADGEPKDVSFQFLGLAETIRLDQLKPHDKLHNQVKELLSESHLLAKQLEKTRARCGGGGAAGAVGVPAAKGGR